MQVILFFLLLASNVIVAHNNATQTLFAVALTYDDMPTAYPMFLAKQAVTRHDELIPWLLLSIEAARADLVEYFIRAGVTLNPDEQSPYYVLNPLELACSYARRHTQYSSLTQRNTNAQSQKKILKQYSTIVVLLDQAGAVDRQKNRTIFDWSLSDQ